MMMIRHAYLKIAATSNNDGMMTIATINDDDQNDDDQNDDDQNNDIMMMIMMIT
jgi:hypothetical protein